MAKIKLLPKDRRRKAFIGGIFGLIIGGWFIFYYKDNAGFLIALLSLILLIWGRE